jgi:hypothetical protein
MTNGAFNRRADLRLYRAAALAALLIVPALAQESAPEAPPPSGTEAPQVIDEVIVRGRRLEEIEDDLRLHVREFIDEVVATPPGRGFARWQRRVCVGVYNLETSAAQYIVDRVSSLALDVGLEPGEPGCSPQVNILFATNASEAASAMVDDDRRLFMRVGGLAGMDLGRSALDEFVKSDKAVRWWHVSMPVDAHTGLPAIQLMPATCAVALCAPQVNVQGPSRVHNGTRDDLQYVIILVDATKLKGTTWQQLGDYLAVISLAQIDPKSNPAAFDSILNLFSNPAAYSGLTDWDRSYVRALYALDQERIASIQRNEIVSRIARRELEGDR